MPTPCLKVSVDFCDRISEMYDFVWPTAASLWIMRETVGQYISTHPQATDLDLKVALFASSGIYGASLRKAAVTHTWDQHRAELARVVLVTLFAHYEGWLAELCEQFGADEQVAKNLQSWKRMDKNGKVIGQFTDALATICGVKSVAMAQSFENLYKASPRVAGSRLEAMLTCLRYFKECRNCIAHNGARIDQKVVDAYALWKPFANPTSMGLSEEPEHSVPSLGASCDLSLRGVVGFGDVLLSIAWTVDAEVSGTATAEKEFLDRVRKKLGARQIEPKNLSGTCRLAGYPTPASAIELERLLRSEGLMR
jgi:hypothetical protein